MIKVTGMSANDMANAIDRVSRQRNKDGHAFKDMGIKGMENICDYCLMTHKERESK